MKKTHKTAHTKSIRTTVWLHFHAWTLGALAIVSALNSYSILHAPSDQNLSSSLAPNLLLATAPLTHTATRAPANLPEPGSADDSIAEIEMSCTADLAVTLSPRVHTIRLTMTSCPGTTTQIRNETNGFEGTVFRGPASLEAQKSSLTTDFMTLEKGRNRIRIVLNQPGAAPAERWLSIVRTPE